MEYHLTRKFPRNSFICYHSVVVVMTLGVIGLVVEGVVSSCSLFIQIIHSLLSNL
jgi:hypothetical protein